MHFNFITFLRVPFWILKIPHKNFQFEILKFLFYSLPCSEGRGDEKMCFLREKAKTKKRRKVYCLRLKTKFMANNFTPPNQLTDQQMRKTQKIISIKFVCLIFDYLSRWNKKVRKKKLEKFNNSATTQLLHIFHFKKLFIHKSCFTNAFTVCKGIKTTKKKSQSLNSLKMKVNQKKKKRMLI